MYHIPNSDEVKHEMILAQSLQTRWRAERMPFNDIIMPAGILTTLTGSDEPDVEWLDEEDADALDAAARTVGRTGPANSAAK